MYKIRLFLLVVSICGKTNVKQAFGLLQDKYEISYEAKIISNEFIIQYHFKYKLKTRARFLYAAQKKTNLTVGVIVPRKNAANIYPSDFDIFRIKEYVPNIDEVISMISSHPAIKNIVPNRSVQRYLNYVNLNLTNYNRRTSGLIKKLKHNSSRQIASVLHADILWNHGITGKGIRVAVFDTGLTKNHPHFRKVKERTNWTNEKTLDDGVSHGTFVAGVIASSKECLGFAPDSELHIYRVFTNTQVSYTSWFLDAFNYAIFKKINIINLSIGGPDFMDLPFVDKVLELSANKVIMVSAIGNDGPLYGTLNNPGDQMDVIGVGGIGFDDKISKFSSRGMTTWELPHGYGRLKPDIVTYGSQVEGSDVHSGCRSLSGTSVSSPVVAGAVTLLASGALDKLHIVNPSSMKQVLIEGATKLRGYNMFEQGHGKFNLLRSMQLLLSYKPKISLNPAYLNFSEDYMWPYNTQPLFYGSMPVIVNVTILNGISVSSKILGRPLWQPYKNSQGNLLNISISFAPIIWPWCGWMAVHIVVTEEATNYQGIFKGHISISIENLFASTNVSSVSNVIFPISVKITPTPPRHKRILWDQYHNLRYPPGYIPRDNLKVKSDPLDWRADHIHTNFRDMYTQLRNSGYYVEILREPFSCFNSSAYGTLLIVDPEEEFFDEEIVQLQNYVYDDGLSVLIFADWYNTTVMKKIKFFDENTRQWWIPDTGGANVPALNDLLKPFGVALDDFVAEGYFKLGDHSMYYASGSTIASFPDNDGDIVIGAYLNDQGSLILNNTKIDKKETKLFVPILGLFQTKQLYRKNIMIEELELSGQHVEENYINENEWESDLSENKNPLLNKRVLLQQEASNSFEKQREKRSTSIKEGRLVIYGDSNCLDSTHLDKACYWLLNTLLDYTMNSHKSSLLVNLNRIFEFRVYKKGITPQRLLNSNLYKYSKVFDGETKIKKSKINSCEHLNWETGIVVDAVDLKRLNQNITIKNDDDDKRKSLIDALNLEISGVYMNELISKPGYIDLNVKTALFFMITISVTMFIVFVSFLRGKRRY